MITKGHCCTKAVYIQTFKRIAKVMTTCNRKRMVQYVTGVNTEASFIHEVMVKSFFSREVGTFFVLNLLIGMTNFKENGFSAISVCLTLDFTAIMYCFMYIYMHVSRLNKVRLNRRIS